MTTEEVVSEKGIFYGWWILGACCFIFMVGGVMTYAGTIYFPAMMEEMGWQYGDLSLIVAVLLWSGILWSPVAGWLTDKLGCRRTLIIGIAAFLLTGIFLSMVTEIWQVIVYWSLLAGFAQSIVLGVTVHALLRRWFMKRAGLVVSIMFLCSALFEAIMFPALNRISVETGFRPAVLAFTIITQAISLVLVFFLVKETPEQMGLNVDGMTTEEKDKFMTDLGGEVIKEKSNTLAEAIRMPQFWLWELIYGLSSGVLMGLTGNITTIGMSLGSPAAVVGTIMTFFMLTSVIGRLGAGWLGDRFGKRKVLIAAAAISGLILLAGYLWVRTPVAMDIFMFCLGLFIMAPIVLMMPWVGDLFGRLHLSKIMGVIVSIATVITGAYVLLAGIIKSVTGSYIPYLGICAATMLVVVILLFLLRPTETQRSNMDVSV